MRVAMLVVATAVLVAAAWWGHLRFNLDLGVTSAVVGLVGVAAGVVALYAPKPRRQCLVSDPYFTITRPAGDNFLHFSVEAKLLNAGEQAVVLREVKALFYRRDGTVGELGLLFGARDLQAASGQILPMSLAPGVSYLVEGKDHVGDGSPLARFVLAGEYEDFLLRCSFRFAQGRPITIRLRPFSSDPPPVVATLVAEFKARFRRA